MDAITPAAAKALRTVLNCGGIRMDALRTGRSTSVGEVRKMDAMRLTETGMARWEWVRDAAREAANPQCAGRACQHTAGRKDGNGITLHCHNSPVLFVTAAGCIALNAYEASR